MTRRPFARIAFAAVLLCSLLLAGCGGSNLLAPHTYNSQTVSAALSGDQELARPTTSAFGSATFQLDRVAMTLSGSVTADGMVPTKAHLHLGAPGANGSIAIPLEPNATGATLAPTAITPDQLASLDAGNLYVNLHSAAFPSGEIRGQLGREVYTASLSGAQELAQVDGPATGIGMLVLSPQTGQVTGDLQLQNITATAAHVHAGTIGTNGAVQIELLPQGPAGHFVVPDGTFLSASQIDSLRAGGLYFNAHSTAHPGGATRGQIGRRVVAANGSGAQEVPPTPSTATGRALIAMDPFTRALSGNVTLSGLAATKVHLHAGATGSSGPVVVELVQTAPGSGVWAVPPATTLSADRAKALLSGGVYFNAHSAAFPNGELRGQLLPQ